MAAKQIPQGKINRLRGSISFPDFPIINITPAYLGSEMIKVIYTGETTTIINSATGIITSPEPYILVEIQAHVLRTNGLADLIFNQLQTSSTVNNAIVRSDSSTSQDVTIFNTSITNLGEVVQDGKNAAQMIHFKGYLPINNSLFGA